MSDFHVVFAGGGTGGHLFPGLAVAERLAAASGRLRISFCGSGKAMEREHVTRAGFDYFALPSRSWRRGIRAAAAFGIANLAGYLAAVRFLRSSDVAAVVGLGGYASVPLAWAARRGVPLVLLEQNVVAGKATRWLAPRATLVCTAFEETSATLRCRCPVRVTGNPVRHDFHDSRTPGRRRGRRRQLLVLGGSGGAQSLNESVPRALHQLGPQLQGWHVIHQSGEAGLEAARAIYRRLALEAEVLPFLGNMPEVLPAADLVVCRAGGTTLAELAVAGVPAVLLPYPQAADDHQAANARHYAAGGGCVTIDARQTPDRLDARLADTLRVLLADEAQRERMAAAMCALARPRAAEDVAELVGSVIGSCAGRSAAAA